MLALTDVEASGSEPDEPLDLSITIIRTEVEVEADGVDASRYWPSELYDAYQTLTES